MKKMIMMTLLLGLSFHAAHAARPSISSFQNATSEQQHQIETEGAELIT